MSLEQALQENTNAILKLADLITANQTVISIAKPPVAITAEASVVKKEIETTTTTDVEEHLNATAEVETEQAREELQDASVTAIAITRDDVKNALLSVAKKSRSDLQEILGKFGAANISALKESDFPEVIRLADEVLETADA